jgi:hypothetical protein
VALSNAELTAQRSVTAAFIAADSTELELVPRSKVRTAGAGYKFQEQTPRPIQTFKLIWTTDRNRPVVTLDGKQTQVDLILLGHHSAVVAVHDWIKLDDGREGEVIALQPGYGYQIKALAVLRG